MRVEGWGLRVRVRVQVRARVRAGARVSLVAELGACEWQRHAHAWPELLSCVCHVRT